MMYWTCPYCGSNLDPDEKCDCKNDCNREARNGDDKLNIEKENCNGELQFERHQKRC